MDIVSEARVSRRDINCLTQRCLQARRLQVCSHIPTFLSLRAMADATQPEKVSLASSKSEIAAVYDENFQFTDMKIKKAGCFRGVGRQ